jgi:peptidyl-prolyl cis-trans isomerase A (cyclophilin A)
MSMAAAKLGRRSFVVGAGLLAGTPGAALAAPAKPRVLIKTNHGAILVELEAEKAPITAANFLRYVDAQAYDGGVFYRASRDPGAPKNGTIVGRPDLKIHPFPAIPHESTTKTGLRHVTGTISLGRFDPGTATSNFFICASPEPYLDAHPGAPGDNLGYAAFGQVVQGLAVVRKILSLPTNGETKFAEQRGEWLKPPVPILSMRRAG